MGKAAHDGFVGGLERSAWIEDNGEDACEIAVSGIVKTLCCEAAHGKTMVLAKPWCTEAKSNRITLRSNS